MACEVLRTVARLHRHGMSPHVISGDQKRGAEALDLQRPSELVRQAVPNARRRKCDEGRENDRDDGADRRETDHCLPPSLATPRERDGQRNEYGGEELRRDRRAEYAAAETQPSRDERRKRRDDERGRPEVVTAQ